MFYKDRKCARNDLRDTVRKLGTPEEFWAKRVPRPDRSPYETDPIRTLTLVHFFVELCP